MGRPPFRDRSSQPPRPPPTPTDQPGRRPIRRALVSVYDKTGLEELARGLHEAGVALVSTGGSAALIEGLGLPVTKVEDLTGFPECLEGRVKTLHPRVHAGILADTRKADHVAQLADLGVEPFELVVVNLYPFRETVASGAGPDEVIEQIDIGGPSMVRAAAKNHPSVAVVTDPAAYPAVLAAVAGGGFTLTERKRLAAQAFVHTADYDNAVANWMGNAYTDTSDGTGFPAWTGATFQRANVLRYGENPHQPAALYTHWRPGVASAEQLHGKEMSYNNYIDTDAAVRAAHDHGDQPTVAIIKHANPCGIAVGATVEQAYAAAHACDPVSAYGGIIATNRAGDQGDGARCQRDLQRGRSLPRRSTTTRWRCCGRRRTAACSCCPPTWRRTATPSRRGRSAVACWCRCRDRIDARRRSGDEPGRRRRRRAGGWSPVAAADEATAGRPAVRLAGGARREVQRDPARQGRRLGRHRHGPGQPGRLLPPRGVAGHADGADRARGAVAASDAFFPFADGLQVLLDAGVRAVVAPGGSVRDEEVVAAAEAAGVTMYFTGTRHFAH